jgi:hypothetical protein
VLRTGGRGPAAARNAGWRAVGTEWVAFLDDDVVPGPGWTAQLARDLDGLAADVGASQGCIEVPLPTDRRPTDVERGTAGLADARWITADMAYRRAALQRVGGFDERFGRAYREDADLALRVIAAGYHIVTGQRRTVHPVRPSGPLASVRAQRGNADDVLMRAVHGPDWRERAGVPRGRRRRHLATTATLACGVAGFATGRRALAVTGLCGYAVAVAEFAYARIAPGPRTPREIATMSVTSAVVPVAATYHWLRGWARVRALVETGSPLPIDVDGDVPHAAERRVEQPA